MRQQFRRRRAWVVLAVIALAVAGVAVAVLADDRSSGSSAAPADARPSSCRDAGDLTAEERQNCELTGSSEPHPVLNVRLREPIVRGMTFAKAQDLLREAGNELTWIRAHEHPLPLPKWVVCYQAEPILREGDHVRFVTRLVLAPECPPSFPRIRDGEELSVAEQRLDALGIRHVRIDAADEDFPQAPTGVGPAWVVCGPTNVLHEIAGWLTGQGNSGQEYESGDKLIVNLRSAPDRAGCSRSNEEEEQGGGSVLTPDVVGMNYYKAVEVAESIGVDLDYPADPNLSSDWIVCEQDPPAGRRLSRSRFDTLRVRFAPSC